MQTEDTHFLDDVVVCHDAWAAVGEALLTEIPLTALPPDGSLNVATGYLHELPVVAVVAIERAVHQSLSTKAKDGELENREE